MRTIIFISICFLLSIKSVAQPESKGEKELQAFDYGEVELLDGPLKRQLDQVKSYYLRIPNDDILKGFRERAGLSTHGAHDLGGWYSNNVFHVFGQFLSGLSRLYATTGDESCLLKLNALITGWGKTIDPNGFFYYADDPHAPHYIYEKMVGGLVDAYVFTGHQEALTHLSTITDWAIDNLTHNKRKANEWYTLSENLYRAWLVTGDKKYLEYANVWEYDDYWGDLREKKDIFADGGRFHAYSHLNTLSSAAAAYLVKGDEKYLKTIMNGYDFFQQEQCYATGGFGPNERLLPQDQLVETFKVTHKSFETQCGSWAGFKLSKYLISFTADGRYGDWIEKLMINGIGADIPMSADGRVFYYSDYNPREGAKTNYYQGWSCCTGTRPQAVAEYANLIYFKNDKDLYTNLFVPSKVKWNDIELTQQTRFPEGDETTFSFRIPGDQEKEFTFKFRKPSWSVNTLEIYVNGNKIKAELNNNWLSINRKWKDSDEVRVIFPMELKISRLNSSQQYPAAITYGPVVLATRSANMDKYPETFLEGKDPFQNFIPVEGEPLTYHVTGKSDLLVRPFYLFEEDESYIMYLDPSVKNRILEKDIHTNGNWLKRGYYHTKDKGATMTTSFTGDGIKLYLNSFPQAGKFKLKIDDTVSEVIDLYGSEVHRNLQREYRNLGPGEHTLTITVLGEKNPYSRNTYVYVTGFEVLN